MRLPDRSFAAVPRLRESHELSAMLETGGRVANTQYVNAAISVHAVSGARGIGSPAPDFDLPDHRGEVVRLYDRLGAGGLVLVFFRGHWCPYCRRYLAKLQTNLPRLRAAGADLLAVSPEPPATSAAFVAELGLGFPILSDADGQVIDRFGTRNGYMGGGSVLPHPSVFVIDAGGAVRFRSIDRNYKKRTTVRTILAALAELAVERVTAGPDAPPPPRPSTTG